MLMTRAQRARLGLFFVGVAGLLVATGSLLFGRRAFRQDCVYRVLFHESVSGLEQSAPVRYQGLHVGQVSAMRVASDDSRAIEVSLAIDANIRLYEGTLAQLDLSGLTGLKAINLVPGDARSRLLVPGEIIAESTSGLGHLTENAAAVIANIKSISDQLGAFVNPQNRVRLEHLIGGIDTLVGHANHFLEQSEDSLGRVVGNVADTTVAVGHAADAASKLMTSGQGTMARLEREIAATLLAVREPLSGLDAKSVRDTVANLHQAGVLLNRRLSDKEAGVAIAAVGDTAERINHLVQDVDLAVRAGREDFAKSLSYLRQAAEDLREFSRILAQNPSVLVRGRNNAD